MTQLTDKQRYQREYYAKNKEAICAKKRKQYAEGDQPSTLKRKPKPCAAARTLMAPAKATHPVKLVDKMPRKARHAIADIEEARELGISVEELRS